MSKIKIKSVLKSEDDYEFNGLNYNINCRSSFLDLIDESGRTFATDVTRVTQDDDAFELFDQNRCSTGAYGSGDCEYVGPSWRLKGSSNEWENHIGDIGLSY